MTRLRLGLLIGQLGLAIVAAIAVAACALVLSFDAQTAVAEAAHIRRQLAGLLPVSVDGLLGVATFALVALHSARRRTRAYVWLLFFCGLGVSIGCNAAHSLSDGGRLVLPGALPGLVSAVPPLSAAATIHLVVMLVRHVAAVVSDAVAAVSVAEPAVSVETAPPDAPSLPEPPATPAPALPAVERARPVLAEAWRAGRAISARDLARLIDCSERQALRAITELRESVPRNSAA